MIKETDGDRFEAMRSMNQELTFETTEKEFQLRKIEFGTQQMRTLKLIDQDGLYSNLAMLLSDQCVHTIKVAVFQGKDQTVFKDRREFAGALMKQMNDVYDYIDFHNQTHATIEKLLRIDVRDYPEIDLEDVMAGISVCRNQDLANVFYRLGFVEIFGTGVMRIKQLYEDGFSKPDFEVSENSIKIVLPNFEKDVDLTEDERIVYKILSKNLMKSISEIAPYVPFGKSKTTQLLKSMGQKGIITVEGRGRGTKYIIR